MAVYKISPQELKIEDLQELIKPGKKIALSEEAKSKINACRVYLNKKLKEFSEPIYGINTGFGALYNKSIPEKDLSNLQHNLVVSHACGTGEMVPPEIVKIMLL